MHGNRPARHPSSSADGASSRRSAAILHLALGPDGEAASIEGSDVAMTFHDRTAIAINHDQRLMYCVDLISINSR
jgi:hypothetical protein